MKSKYTLRLIQESDTQEVLAIYQYYVENTFISFEYEAPTMEEYLERIKVNTEKYPWLVCLENNKIIGFAYCSTHRYRTAYQWSPESTIYVTPNFHTKGIGKILYNTLFELLKLQGYYNVFAGVALPNDKSIGFHKKMKFEEIGLFKNVGFKHGNWHHTHWFQLQLTEHNLAPKNPKMLIEMVHLEEFKNILMKANELLEKIAF
jgi:phosphinothricin acetyltransferase